MLKLQYFGHLIQSQLIRKDLKVGKTEGKRGWQRTRRSDGITDSMGTRLSKLQEMWRTGKPGVLQSVGSQSRTRPSDWTTCQSQSPNFIPFYVPLPKIISPSLTFKFYLFCEAFLQTSSIAGTFIALSIQLIVIWASLVAQLVNNLPAGDLGLILGLVRSPGEGNVYPLQYSCLENPMNRGAWWAIVPGVAKSQTWLSNEHLQHFRIYLTVLNIFDLVFLLAVSCMKRQGYSFGFTVSSTQVLVHAYWMKDL